MRILAYAKLEHMDYLPLLTKGFGAVGAGLIHLLVRLIERPLRGTIWTFDLTRLIVRLGLRLKRRSNNRANPRG